MSEISLSHAVYYNIVKRLQAGCIKFANVGFNSNASLACITVCGIWGIACPVLDLIASFAFWSNPQRNVQESADWVQQITNKGGIDRTSLVHAPSIPFGWYSRCLGLTYLASFCEAFLPVLELSRISDQSVDLTKQAGSQQKACLRDHFDIYSFMITSLWAMSSEERWPNRWKRY